MFMGACLHWVSDGSELDSQLHSSQCERCSIVGSIEIHHAQPHQQSHRARFMRTNVLTCSCFSVLLMFSEQQSLPASKTSHTELKVCASCKHNLTDEASPQNTPQILCKTLRDQPIQVRRKEVHNAVVLMKWIYQLSPISVCLCSGLKLKLTANLALLPSSRKNDTRKHESPTPLWVLINNIPFYLDA